MFTEARDLETLPFAMGRGLETLSVGFAVAGEVAARSCWMPGPL
jgi:hypothetical protein